jgi:hypothetical protein
MWAAIAVGLVVGFILAVITFAIGVMFGISMAERVNDPYKGTN